MLIYRFSLATLYVKGQAVGKSEAPVLRPYRPLPSISAATPASSLLQRGCRQLKDDQKSEWGFQKSLGYYCFLQESFLSPRPHPTPTRIGPWPCLSCLSIGLYASCCLLLLTYHLQFWDRSALAQRPRPIHPGFTQRMIALRSYFRFLLPRVAVTRRYWPSEGSNTSPCWGCRFPPVSLFIFGKGYQIYFATLPSFLLPFSRR